MIGVYFGLKTTSAQPNIKPTIVIDAGTAELMSS